MNVRQWASVLGPAAALGLGACGGGGGGGAAAVVVENASNGSAATATPLPAGRPASGSLDGTGDVDFWSLSLSAGETVAVELFATRLDQARWDTVVNAPRLTLFDTDGTTKLLEHDLGGFTSAGWGWGLHDLDFPLFRAPASGTYFVCVRQDDGTRQGGDYVFAVHPRTLTGYQAELEPAATAGANDTVPTAEALAPGVLHGFHVDGESDVFAFTLSAPSVVRFEVTSYRNGVWHGDDAYFDSTLRLVDQDGLTDVATADESFFSDPALHQRLDAPGTYYLAVEEAGGSGDAEYFLSFARESLAGVLVEAEDNDTTATAEPLAYGQRVSGTVDALDPDVYFFQGTAGDLVRVQSFDAANWTGAADTIDLDVLAPDGVTSVAAEPNRALRVHSFLLTQTGAYYLAVDASAAPTDYVLALERHLGSAFESENNDALANADVLDENGRASGVIAVNNDQDFFAFQASAGVPVTIRVLARAAVHSDGFQEFSGHGSELQPFVRIRNASGGGVATAHFGRFIGAEGVVDGLPTCSVTFVPETSGAHYIEVESITNVGSARSCYLVEKR